MARPLAELMKEANQEVPQWLEQYASRAHFGSSGGGRKGRGGGGAKFGAATSVGTGGGGGGGAEGTGEAAEGTGEGVVGMGREPVWGQRPQCLGLSSGGGQPLCHWHTVSYVCRRLGLVGGKGGGGGRAGRGMEKRVSCPRHLAPYRGHSSSFLVATTHQGATGCISEQATAID